MNSSVSSLAELSTLVEDDYDEHALKIEDSMPKSPHTSHTSVGSNFSLSSSPQSGVNSPRGSFSPREKAKSLEVPSRDQKHASNASILSISTDASNTTNTATTTTTSSSSTNNTATTTITSLRPSSVMNSLLSLSPASSSKRLTVKSAAVSPKSIPSLSSSTQVPIEPESPSSDLNYFMQAKKSKKRKTLGASLSQDSLDSPKHNHYYSSTKSQPTSPTPSRSASDSSLPSSPSMQLATQPLAQQSQQHLDSKQFDKLHQLYFIIKQDIFQMFQFCSLPSQYNSILKRANHLIINIENQERYLNHLELREYFYHELNVLLHALNEIIQLLYDVVEDRVMRGEKISPPEAQYFEKIDSLYQHLLHDIYEKMNPPLHVQMLNTEVEQSKTAQFRKIKQWENHSNENKASTITLQDEELEIFQQRYLYRFNEKLLNAGVVLKIKKDKKLLRYIWLTTYQLMISEQIYVLKSCIDLISISKVNSLSPTYFEIVTEKSEKILLYSKDAQKWCKNIQKAIKSLLSLREWESTGSRRRKRHHRQRANSTHSAGGSSYSSTMGSFASDFSQLSQDTLSNELDRDTNSSFSSTPVDQAALDRLDEELDLNAGRDSDEDGSNLAKSPPQKRSITPSGGMTPQIHSPQTPRSQPEYIEIEVHLLKAENLRPPKKNRPDNPYCWLGVGNPEHYKQDRTERQKSNVVRGKNPVWDQKFILHLKPQNSFLLDIRVYSQIPQCNHFSYGECTVSLKQLFVGDNKVSEIRGWHELTFHGGKQGRVYVSVRIRTQEFPSWLFRSRPIRTPAITTHDEFYIYRSVPMIFGGIHRDICALLKLTSNNKRFVLQDASTKRDIYTLERSNAAWNWKKTYVIKDSNGVRIGKCFHKMKSIRKRKLRLFLANSECLFSMEGGCFNQKSFNNEVLIKNSCGVNVASVVFVDNGSDSLWQEKKCVIVRILEGEESGAGAVSSHIDTMLLLLFSVYTFV